jgi:hypothetical protein
MTTKTISQNADRYSKQGSSWVISASNSITPIYLPIGIPLSNLKPLIQADGIIVKVGEDYLCSLTTLNLIKDSNNPHYDIIQNGTIMVKDKEVGIGKTIKIIELDISRLETIGNLQDTKGIKAGVSSVEYIYEGTKTDGVADNLITQINYTLNQDSIRGLDTYTLYQLKLAPPEAYSLDALSIVLQPPNELLDMPKLKVFIEGVKERLILLRSDFNMIKKMFFEGQIPVNMGKVEITANSLSDPNQQLLGAKDYHQVIYKEVGELQSVRDTQQTQRAIKSEVAKTQQEIEQQANQFNQELQVTQQANSQTQAQIIQQLQATQTQLAETQKKLTAGSK